MFWSQWIYFKNVQATISLNCKNWEKINIFLFILKQLIFNGDTRPCKIPIEYEKSINFKKEKSIYIVYKVCITIYH